MFSGSVTAAPTTATATSVATSTTTAASSIATSTTTTTATAIFSGLGFIDGERSAFVVFLVETRNRSLGFGVVSHLDETKSFAATTAAVRNYLGTFDRSEL